MRDLLNFEIVRLGLLILALPFADLSFAHADCQMNILDVSTKNYDYVEPTLLRTDRKEIKFFSSSYLQPGPIRLNLTDADFRAVGEGVKEELRSLCIVRPFEVNAQKNQHMSDSFADQAKRNEFDKTLSDFVDKCHDKLRSILRPLTETVSQTEPIRVVTTRVADSSKPALEVTVPGLKKSYNIGNAGHDQRSYAPGTARESNWFGVHKVVNGLIAMESTDLGKAITSVQLKFTRSWRIALEPGLPGFASIELIDYLRDHQKKLEVKTSMYGGDNYRPDIKYTFQCE